MIPNLSRGKKDVRKILSSLKLYVVSSFIPPAVVCPVGVFKGVVVDKVIVGPTLAGTEVGTTDVDVVVIVVA